MVEMPWFIYMLFQKGSVDGGETMRQGEVVQVQQVVVQFMTGLLQWQACEELLEKTLVRSSQYQSP